MKLVDEYRDARLVKQYADAIAGVATKSWSIMEVCGGQTHAIVRYGLDQLLPQGIELIHGPGCPVCVTPLEQIDRALAIARKPGVIFCSFGDMLRVPGSVEDLQEARSRGADVRVVYSPLDALALAEKHADREVVFFAIGFETTAPANALVVQQAKARGLSNFSVLVSHVLVPPALRALLSSPDRRVDGFIAAGHVCTVMGLEEYEPIAAEYHAPIVVTGFEPADIMQGVLMCVRQLEAGRAEVENQYSRAVRAAGNTHAQDLIREVFEIGDRKWRGIGSIPDSGFRLRPSYAAFDAETRFAVSDVRTKECPTCLSGLVLQGARKPTECPEFGTRCTPEHPLGATMVSTEGACAAYYRYRGAEHAAEATLRPNDRPKERRP